MSVDALLRAAHGVVVGRARVVRHDVARLELHALEHERVAGRQIAQCAGAVVQRHRAFCGAVHRIHQIELRHAIVVLGARLRVDLVDREHFLIAARLHELHRRRTIGQHVDRIVERAGDHFSVRSLAARPYRSRPCRRAASPSSGRRRSATSLSVSPPSTTTRPPDVGTVGATRMRTIVPLQRGDVARAVDVLRLSCVYAGIAILQIHPLHVRQVRHVDRVRRRAHAVRLDGVLRLARRCRTGGTRSARVLSAQHRDARPAASSRRCARAARRFRLEAAQPRLDQLVAALGDGRVARLDREC